MMFVEQSRPVPGGQTPCSRKLDFSNYVRLLEHLNMWPLNCRDCSETRRMVSSSVDPKLLEGCAARAASMEEEKGRLHGEADR